MQCTNELCITDNKIGIVTDDPMSSLEINGEIQIGDDSSACDVTKAGAIHWNGEKFEGCNGTNWMEF